MSSLRRGFAAILCAAATAASAQVYQFTTLDPKQANYSITPEAINDSGAVSGVWTDPAQIDHGFVAQGGSFNSFDAPLADTGKVIAVRGTWASGIDSAGDVVGVYTAGGAQHGFVRSAGGSTTTLDIAGRLRTALLGVNDSGQIIGDVADDNSSLSSSTSFLRSAAGALTVIVMPGSTFSEAMGLNNAGFIVGGYDDAANVAHGYERAPNGVYTTIDVAGADTTVASGINDAGWIVGEYDVAGVAHGFVRDPLGAVTTLDPSGATFASATAINNIGTIVGQYCDAGNVCHGFVAAQVPEPSAWALTTVGWSVVLLLRRRRPSTGDVRAGRRELDL